MNIFLAVCLGLVLALLMSRLVKKGEPVLPYHTRGNILTKAELNFYRQLCSVTNALGIIINTKSRMWDIVDVDKGVEKQFSYQNKISSKHIDFVLLDQNMNILGCIELDDSSHQLQEAKENDAFKDLVLKSAKIPLIRVKATKQYNLSSLQNQLVSLLKND